MPVLRGAGEPSGATKGWHPSAIGRAGHGAGSQELPKLGCGTSRGLEASLSLPWLCALLYSGEGTSLAAWGRGRSDGQRLWDPGRGEHPLAKFIPH